MSTVKLIALLLVSFIATGSVVYQIRSRRNVRPPIVSSPSRPAAAPVAPPLPADAPPTEAAANPEQPGGTVAAPAATEIRTNIPQGTWGRNPFLTREEIDKLNAPPVTEIVETAAPAPTPRAPVAPTYTVTAIIYGPNGSYAVVNSRVVQAGDRVGIETVKEIKSRAVVLEYDGRIRELPLRRMSPDIQLGVPRGD